jgi:LysM repeat protein
MAFLPSSSWSRVLGRLARAAAVLAIASAPVLVPATASAATHQVTDGQSLRGIAKKYGVSVSSIKLKNHLDSSKIRPGQKLEIPSATEAKQLDAVAAQRKKLEEAKAERDKAEKKAKAALEKKRAAEREEKERRETEAREAREAAREAAEKEKARAEKEAEKQAAKQAKSRSDRDDDKDDDDAPRARRDGPWVPDPPSQRTQTQRTAKDRGVNPCNTDDPGFGVYEPWNRAPSIGQMIIPARGGLTKDGGFDVVIHFHGHEPARKEWVKVMNGPVFVGIDLGIGSGAYQSAFSTPNAFKNLIDSIEKEVQDERDNPKAHVRHVGLSAWSAGYGAVEQILRQPLGKELVDSVILLDGLHTGYDPDGSLTMSGLEPFVDFAKRAKSGKRFMYVSHSSIIPPDYASTTETVRQLIHELGGGPKPMKPRKSDPMGLELNEKWDAGNFHARGYDGNDKMDHCAHLGLLKDVAKAYLKERWKTPKGFGPKAEAAEPKKQKGDHAKKHGDDQSDAGGSKKKKSKKKKKPEEPGARASG